jgi:hypothetical protein
MALADAYFVRNENRFAQNDQSKGECDSWKAAVVLIIRISVIRICFGFRYSYFGFKTTVMEEF